MFCPFLKVQTIVQIAIWSLLQQKILGRCKQQLTFRFNFCIFVRIP